MGFWAQTLCGAALESHWVVVKKHQAHFSALFYTHAGQGATVQKTQVAPPYMIIQISSWFGLKCPPWP